MNVIATCIIVLAVGCSGRPNTTEEFDVIYAQRAQWVQSRSVTALLFSRGTTAGIQSSHANRLRLLLGRLNVAKEPRDMGLPGLNLHPLKGARQGTWAVRVSGNWRLTFRFEGRDVADVNYEDYH